MRDGIHSKWIADQPNGSLKFRVTNDFVTEITVKNTKNTQVAPLNLEINIIYSNIRNALLVNSFIN